MMRNILATLKRFSGAFIGLLLSLIYLQVSPVTAKPRPRTVAPQGDEQVDIIYRMNQSSSVEVWQIKKPDVRRHMTEYPNIIFREGDQIMVTASGCVQTGGKGKTWKRYVNPLGENADRLYHGLVWIPGATAGLVRISSVLGKRLTIPLKADIPFRLHLRLGYEDDDYEDNGYWQPDDGNPAQCKGSGAAVVTITVTHTKK